MASSSTGLLALRRTADVVLSSDGGLSELYESKGEISSGAQAGCVSAVDRRTGVTYALHMLELEDMLPDILGHVSSREPSMERSPPIRRSEANSSAENVDALMVTTMLSHEASYMPSPLRASAIQ